MKWIAIILLLLNIGFWFWQENTDTTAAASTDLARVSVSGERELFLLNEIADLAPFQSGEAAAGKTASESEPMIVSARPETKAAVKSPARKAVTVCVTLGPIPLDQAPKTIEAWFRGRDAQTRLRKKEKRQRTSTWVFLPRQESRDAANELINVLIRRKVKDYFLIKSGSMENAVSLGLYSEETSVVGRLTELRDKGFNPQSEPRYRTNTSHWLDVRFADSENFSEKIFKGLFPNVPAVPVSCAKIAMQGRT